MLSLIYFPLDNIKQIFSCLLMPVIDWQKPQHWIQDITSWYTNSQFHLKVVSRNSLTLMNLSKMCCLKIPFQNSLNFFQIPFNPPFTFSYKLFFSHTSKKDDSDRLQTLSTLPSQLILINYHSACQHMFVLSGCNYGNLYKSLIWILM